MGNKKRKSNGSEKPGTIGFSQSSADGKKLEKMLKKQVISPGCPPKMIQELYPEFQKYKADSFAGCVRRMRTRLGMNVRPVAPAIGKFDCCFWFDVSPSNSLTFLSPEDSSDEDDDAVMDDDSEDSGDERSVMVIQKPLKKQNVKLNHTALAGLELVRSEEEVWLPLFIMNKWQGHDMVWHVALAIVAPSGVGYLSSSDIDLHLEKDAMELVVTVTWPTWVLALLFLLLINEEERSTRDFVLMEFALTQRLAQMRPKKSSPLKSVARIPLPFQVRPSIDNEDWKFLGENKSGTRVILIDLKAPSDGEYEGNKIKSCTIEAAK